MARPVGDERLEIDVSPLALRRNLRNLRVLFGRVNALECRAERVDDLEVRPLVAAPDVVFASGRALLEDEEDALAVVFDVEPVAHVAAVAVNREGLPLE